MIKPGRFFRSLIGLISGTWLIVLLIDAPLALFVNKTFDEISFFDPGFLTNYGYKNWGEYALREGPLILGVILMLTALVCMLGFIVHAILYRLNWRHLHNYLGTGVFIAAVFSLLAVLCLFSGASAFPAAVIFSLFLVILIFSAFSAMVALLVFWLIRRPDKDAKQDAPPPSVSA